MQLRVLIHPQKANYFCLQSSHYQVVGSAGWLVETKDLPPQGQWMHKLFTSKKKAEEYREDLDESEAVTLKSIKAFYGGPFAAHQRNR